jgi:hypothetical protein
LVFKEVRDAAQRQYPVKTESMNIIKSCICPVIILINIMEIFILIISATAHTEPGEYFALTKTYIAVINP